MPFFLLLSMEHDKLFFLHMLLYYFDLKKTATHKLLVEAYGNCVPSEKIRQKWFQRFKSGDYDVNDKQRSNQPKKCEDTELQALLNENSAQTLQELSRALNVTPMAVSKRLHAMEKIQKEGKWVPHELTENAIANRLNISLFLCSPDRKKKFFVTHCDWR